MPAKNAPAIRHLSFLIAVESTAIKAETLTDQGCKGSVARPSTFAGFTRHDITKSRKQSVPKPASGCDLLKAAALMWANATRFQWPISFAYKEFHLAPEMPLSNALWQPVTILPTCFIALHTRLSGDQRCDLIRGASQDCRRRKKNGLLLLPASKEQKRVPYFAKLNRVRSYNEIPGREPVPWPCSFSSCWR